jgi:hypothetical protein
MYQPYPTSAQIPDTQRPTRPASVINAVRVMYAGAVASVLLAVVEFLTRKSLKASLLRQFPKLAARHPHFASRPFTFAAIVGGVIAVVLWIVIAQSCKAGRNWARIAGTVFFAIATIDALAALAIPFAVGVKIIQLVVWLLGLTAVVLLWRRSSNEYFRAPRA